MKKKKKNNWTKFFGGIKRDMLLKDGAYDGRYVVKIVPDAKRRKKKRENTKQLLDRHEND